MSPRGPGRPTELTQEIVDRILPNVGKALIPRQIAQLSHIATQTMSDWLSRGEREKSEGLDTIFVQFYNKFREEQSKVSSHCIQKLQTCPKNYGALTWLLEKCFKDDFETKSEAHKQLEDFVHNVVKPMINKGDVDA